MKVLIVFFILILNLNAQVTAKKVVSNLGIVWGMTFLQEDKLLVTQKEGKLSLIDLKKREVLNIGNVPNVLFQGQGGLLDIQKSPKYKQEGWLYFTYVKNQNSSGVTTLSRAKIRNNSLFNIEELLVSKSSSNTTRHYGSRITFDEKGHVFFSIGDRGVRANGQDLKTHAGTIIRLNLDGSIPKDNPFVDNPKVLAEIYSYGHRNPQGLFYDKATKKLYSIEHGPRGGDEINVITKGSNYGWPVISYGKEYYAPISVGVGTHKEGMKQPIKIYIPSIAPSSLIVYSGNFFKSWRGNLLSGALKLRHLNRVVLNKKGKVIKEVRVLESLAERIRNVVESPKGKIYISTDNGNIYLLLEDSKVR